MDNGIWTTRGTPIQTLALYGLHTKLLIFPTGKWNAWGAAPGCPPIRAIRVIRSSLPSDFRALSCIPWFRSRRQN